MVYGQCSGEFRTPVQFCDRVFKRQSRSICCEYSITRKATKAVGWISPFLALTLLDVWSTDLHPLHYANRLMPTRWPPHCPTALAFLCGYSAASGQSIRRTKEDGVIPRKRNPMWKRRSISISALWRGSGDLEKSPNWSDSLPSLVVRQPTTEGNHVDAHRKSPDRNKTIALCSVVWWLNGISAYDQIVSHAWWCGITVVDDSGNCYISTLSALPAKSAAIGLSSCVPHPIKMKHDGSPLL